MKKLWPKENRRAEIRKAYELLFCLFIYFFQRNFFFEKKKIYKYFYKDKKYFQRHIFIFIFIFFQRQIKLLLLFYIKLLKTNFFFFYVFYFVTVLLQLSMLLQCLQNLAFSLRKCCHTSYSDPMKLRNPCEIKFCTLTSPVAKTKHKLIKISQGEYKKNTRK